MDRHAIRLIVRGRVQGVGYRVWARDEARRLSLDGWTRNRRDGSVEIMAIGTEHAVAAMAQSCWLGPQSAGVASVDQVVAEDDGSVRFEVRSTD